MRKPRKKLLLALLFVALPVAAAVAWFGLPRSRPGDRDRYTVAPVEWGGLSESVGATGVLQPQEVIVAASALSGQVVEVYPDADVNRTVREGDPLLKIDDRLPRKKLAQAEAAVRLAQFDVARAEAARDIARTELEHARELEQKSLAPAWTVQLAQDRLRAAEATVQAASAKAAEALVVREQAELGVELTVVRVPVATPGSSARRSYTILDRKVVLGQLVAPPESAHLFTFAADVGSMRVHAQVGEDDITRVSPGLAATFNARADGDEETPFEGRVLDVRPVPTRLHGAVFYEARIDVANRRNPRTREWLLRPGMTVSVNIIRRAHPQTWKLPAAALEVEPEKRDQSDAARARLAHTHEGTDGGQWRTVWVLGAGRSPWPVFVRTGGENAAGERGISDGQYVEVLEWDPELEPRPDPKAPATYPRVIIGKPAARTSGPLDQPNLKVF